MNYRNQLSKSRHSLFNCICLLLIALCFTACETTTAGPNQQRTAAQGAATGAILGAIIGNQSDSDNGSNRGAVIGAISGAIIGSNIGEAKDKEIQEYRESQIKLAEAQRKAAIANGSNITDSELEVARIKAATAEAELNKLKKENAENIKRARELAALREREQRAREELEALSAD